MRCFESHRDKKQWKYGTTLTYVEAFLAANKGNSTLSGETVRRVEKYQKALKAHVKAERREAAPPLTTSMVCKLRIRHPLHLCILLAFTFGQRISDMLQLATADIDKVHLQGQGFLVITVRRSKTIKATGPYTLHVRQDSELGPPLKRLYRRCRRQHLPFLFTQSVPLLGLGGLLQIPSRERTRLRKATNAVLKEIDPRLESRSIRRGGLQRIASLGVNLEDLRTHFSKHTSTASLGAYLDFCKWSNTQASLHSLITPRSTTTTTRSRNRTSSQPSASEQSSATPLHYNANYTPYT